MLVLHRLLFHFDVCVYKRQSLLASSLVFFKLTTVVSKVNSQKQSRGNEKYISDHELKVYTWT